MNRISAPLCRHFAALAAALGASLLFLAFFCAAIPRQKNSAPAAESNFYRDVLPILQQHCQVCHRSGEIGPMPLETYEQAKHYARQIKANVTRRIMPPWFADPCCGHFSDDPSLSP